MIWTMTSLLLLDVEEDLTLLEEDSSLVAGSRCSCRKIIRMKSLEDNSDEVAGR